MYHARPRFVIPLGFWTSPGVLAISGHRVASFRERMEYKPEGYFRKVFLTRTVVSTEALQIIVWRKLEVELRRIRSLVKFEPS